MYETPTIQSLGQGQLLNVQGTWFFGPVAVLAVAVVVAVVVALPVYVIA
jgi:hypothetical protein